MHLYETASIWRSKVKVRTYNAHYTVNLYYTWIRRQYTRNGLRKSQYPLQKKTYARRIDINRYIERSNNARDRVLNMESPGAGGRRRGNTRSNVEDQALDQIAKEVRFFHISAQIFRGTCSVFTSWVCWSVCLRCAQAFAILFRHGPSFLRLFFWTNVLGGMERL